MGQQQLGEGQGLRQSNQAGIERKKEAQYWRRLANGANRTKLGLKATTVWTYTVPQGRAPIEPSWD